MGGYRDANRDPGTEAHTSPNTGGYVLLIDDDPGILGVLVDLLRDDENFDVYSALSAEEALRATPAAPPGLILMDVRLPGEDTRAVVAALRARPGWRSVPLAICSGVRDLSQLAVELGAQAYLGKPFDVDDVVQLVEHMGVPRRTHGA
jgi:CheY-like chemotaxis protein